MLVTTKKKPLDFNNLWEKFIVKTKLNNNTERKNFKTIVINFSGIQYIIMALISHEKALQMEYHGMTTLTYLTMDKE